MEIIFFTILAALLVIYVLSLISIWNHPFRQRIAKFFLVIVLVLPSVAATLGGFVIGVMIAFSACFKQTCSPVESSAPLWIPAIALLVSIFITVTTTRGERINRLRANIYEKNVVPIIIVVLLTLFTLTTLGRGLSFLI